VIDNSEKLRDLAARNNLMVGENQRAQLDLYSRLLIEWNSKVNLISRKDEKNIWSSHILHSISLLFYIRFPETAVVADVGSGGGLPGIPISIMIPGLRVVLIESIRKKCVALEDMIRRLGLTNIVVANHRADEVAGRHSHSFDIILARAVAPLKDLVEWSGPLARRNARNEIEVHEIGSNPTAIVLPALIAMKGGDLDQEISEARRGTGLRHVLSIPIRFVGIEDTGLAEKWIVIGEL
jgi:16S rRNA (guanine527-N7)-methyltransferase